MSSDAILCAFRSVLVNVLTYLYSYARRIFHSLNFMAYLNTTLYYIVSLATLVHIHSYANKCSYLHTEP